ncbi:MAG TPA: hypothetical protein VEB66_10725 [Opitutaceae bacterium]|nr:hypothetical protein [Opitutaceae bacterium]
MNTPLPRFLAVIALCLSGPLAAEESKAKAPTVTPAAGPESRTAYPFFAMDKDKDGKVTLAEFTASAQSGLKDGSFGPQGPTKPRAGGVTGRASDPEREGGGRPGVQSGDKAATRIDRERDASGAGVARGESAAANATELFNQLDKDGDGFLSEPEVEAYQATQQR